MLTIPGCRSGCRGLVSRSWGAPSQFPSHSATVRPVRERSEARGRPSIDRSRTQVNEAGQSPGPDQQTWKACWGQPLTSSNLVSSASASPGTTRRAPPFAVGPFDVRGVSCRSTPREDGIDRDSISIDTIAEGRPTVRRFIGRDHELNVLSNALQAVHDAVGAAKPGQCILMRGRRRVGKSSLVEEFLRRTETPYLFFTAAGGTADDELTGRRRPIDPPGAGAVLGGDPGAVECRVQAACGDPARRQSERGRHR